MASNAAKVKRSESSRHGRPRQAADTPATATPATAPADAQPQPPTGIASPAAREVLERLACYHQRLEWAAEDLGQAADDLARGETADLHAVPHMLLATVEHLKALGPVWQALFHEAMVIVVGPPDARRAIHDLDGATCMLGHVETLARQSAADLATDRGRDVVLSQLLCAAETMEAVGHVFGVALASLRAVA